MLALLVVGVCAIDHAHIRQELRTPKKVVEASLVEASPVVGASLADQAHESDAERKLAAEEAANTKLEARLSALSASYLKTVEMGLLGGLSHGSYTDPSRGGTTDYVVRNQCMSRNWETGGVVDNCVIKWDGYERLERVRALYEKAHADNIPGDLVECGVWRGGITVMMKALTRAYDDESRRVWNFDSFNGVPNKKRQEQRADLRQEDVITQKMDEQQWGGSVWERAPGGKQKRKNILTVEEQLVRDNFKRFGLFDDQVKFVKGYFNDTLPLAKSEYGLEQIAVLRVDGDLYSSTMDVLKNLYPLVAPGGYVILDDWPLPQSKHATIDFLRSQGLSEDIVKFDRVTPQTSPEKSVNGDRLDRFSNINQEGYFQKPFNAAPGSLAQVAGDVAP
jgi:hypothetical protein